MLTNLREDEADWAQLAAVYRARWAVEIQFRAWKQSLSLDKALNRRSNEHHMQALVLAAMIAHQLGMRVAASMTAALGRARLSYEKLYDVLATHLVRARDPDEFSAFDLDPRHVRRDKRRRESPVDSRD
jgi:IS4 transposase